MNSWCFFVGPGKTGSTWLYDNLIDHPEIKLPKNIKESNYYLSEDCLDTFNNLFYNYGKLKKIKMDISNTYIYNVDIAKKIKKNHPKAKIIIGFREPVERLISMYLFKQRNGEIPQRLSLKDSLENDTFNLVKHSKYYKLSQPYIKEFGVENIFIFDFNRLKEDPVFLMKDIFKFIGVAEIISYKKLRKKVNPASSFRLKFLSRYSQLASNFLRKNKLNFALNFIKSNSLVQNILFKKITNKTENYPFELTNDFKSLIQSDLQKFKEKFKL